MEKIKLSSQLLDRYLDGTCTTKERSIVEGWYNEQLKVTSVPFSESRYQVVEDEMWQKIRSKSVTRKRRLWQITSVAAACILIVFMTKLLFFPGISPESIKPSLQTLAVVDKANSLVQLPDGSMVILKKGSKISFAKSFKGLKAREVYLTGGAFFDVRHLSNQSFVVHSGKIKTTVLGTAFDIVAEPGSSEVIVRVIRGKVNVAGEEGSIGDLLPNKKVTISLRTSQSTFANVNAVQEMSWTKQDILLNNLEFSAICEHLENRFNVKITILGDDLKRKHSTISLTADENLNEFMQTLCEFNGAEFTYDQKNNQYTIRPNKS
ncbi:FecR family protein [Pedobacter frigidisoli]|uniref:FecR family protein n=1 Tax=Pedobacter frigidisoli TaxID=2530455 RepID=A0A4R0NNI7_9SPHI|nr:FecR family protein [Pedobacter frigidisoli]TCD00735.1 FecR family protein [Pedobacter frigidisoli]